MPRLCPHPTCGAELIGYGRVCRACGRPVEPVAPQRPTVASAIPDTRSEAEIRVAIKSALRAVGFHVWDTEQERPDPRVDAGLPDLLVIGHGVIAFAEIKSAKGKLRPAQSEFAALAIANSGRCYLWRSEADAIAWVEGLERAS